MSRGVSPGGGVLCVLGTRPEAIKLTPVILTLIARGVRVTACSTGQHRDMTRASLADFELAPDLDLPQPGKTPQGFIAAALPIIGAMIARIAPGMVVVQGDTTSTLAGTLAAAYARVPLGHVEVGLRSNAAEPFPEDMNRRLVVQAATHHFAPTPTARAALVREGIPWGAINVTGNPVIDALRLVEARLAADGTLLARVMAELPPLGRHPLVVVTAHRRENHARLAATASAGATLAASRDIDVVVAVHPNPAAGAALSAPNLWTGQRHAGAAARLSRLRHPAPPPPSRADRFGRGAGGDARVGCPVVVLRDPTDRPEGVAAGVARLVGTDPATIVAAAHAAMVSAILPYGDGQTADRIASLVASQVVA